MDKFLVAILALSIYLVNFKSEAHLHRQKRQYSSFSSELNECLSIVKLQSLSGQCGLDNFVFVSRINFYCIGYHRKSYEDPYYIMDFEFQNGYSTEYTPPGITQKTGVLSVRFDLTKLGDTAIILKGYDQNSRPKISSIKINGTPFSCNNQQKITPQTIITTTEAPKYYPAYPESGPNSFVQTVEIKKEIIIKTEKQCGEQKVLHRPFIANGKSTYSGEFPWHSAIFKRTGKISEYICGGSIVTKDMILTAAHCFEEGGAKIIPDRLTVQLGRSNLKKFDRFSQETDVHTIILHEMYNFTTLNHDIAFLKLSTFVEFTNYVQPICMSMSEFPIDGQIGTVAGFGFDELEEHAKELKQVQLKVIDHWTCLESNRDFFGQFLSNRNYCAGFRNGSNVCSGDSGGGMYFKVKDIWYLRGIVSLGFRQDRSNRCEDENYVLFTDIFKYKDWITKFID